MIRINNLSKHFGRKQILNNVNLYAPEGTCIGILGQNGCGKSTLMSVLAGTISKDSGEFFLDGRDLFQDRRQHGSCVGYVPQGIPLIEELSGMDNLRLWYRSRKEIRRELDSGILAILGISDFLRIPVSHMSGGMKKRLSIGCAVAHHPRVLLLDEPSAALDFICKERIANYLREYKNQGGTVLLTTHDIQELPLCDRLFILKQGRLVPYEYDGNFHRLAGQL